MTASVNIDGVMGGKGNKARIIVPPNVMDQLGAGPTPEVLVNVNGFEYRTVVRFQHGTYFISHTIADRKLSGLAVGDPIEVTLTLADSHMAVDARSQGGVNVGTRSHIITT